MNLLSTENNTFFGNQKLVLLNLKDVGPPSSYIYCEFSMHHNSRNVSFYLMKNQKQSFVTRPTTLLQQQKCRRQTLRVRAFDINKLLTYKTSKRGQTGKPISRDLQILNTLLSLGNKCKQGNQTTCSTQNSVLDHFRSKETTMYKIYAQDNLVDAIRNTDNPNVSEIIPANVNWTAGLPEQMDIFTIAKIMLGVNIDISNGLVNRVMGFVTDVKWPLYARYRLCEKQVP
uniref:ATP-dependent DNA helicase n=1 Tax=Glossina pallidipes TaxID=7398 RepID=A0A1B0A3J5_GLOPL